MYAGARFHPVSTLLLCTYISLLSYPFRALSPESQLHLTYSLMSFLIIKISSDFRSDSLGLIHIRHLHSRRTKARNETCPPHSLFHSYNIHRYTNFYQRTKFTPLSARFLLARRLQHPMALMQSAANTHRRQLKSEIISNQ